MYCKKMGVRSHIRFCDLTSKQRSVLEDYISRDKKNMKQEELVKIVSKNIKKLKTNSSFRGYSHKKNNNLYSKKIK
jgi:ribosomal protein S13